MKVFITGGKCCRGAFVVQCEKDWKGFWAFFDSWKDLREHIRWNAEETVRRRGIEIVFSKEIDSRKAMIDCIYWRHFLQTVPNHSRKIKLPLRQRASLRCHR